MPAPNEKKGDPALWWLDYEFDRAYRVYPQAMVKVRDFWIMVTEYGVFKFYVDFGDEPHVQKLCEF